MLNIKNMDDVHPLFKPLLVEFRRVQVSRFPINVDANEHTSAVRFVDSRFPNAGWRHYNMLASLTVKGFDAKGKPVIEMLGRLINNEKFATHSDNYYTRSTTDPKKVAKWLRDYVKPYTALEIAKKSGNAAQDRHCEWQINARSDARSLLNISAASMYEEVKYLKSVGTQFKTDAFRKLAENLEALEEANRRSNKDFRGVHVYINPDESIAVGDVVMEKTWEFDSVEQAPTVIQQQLGMLRMVDDNVFLPHVGMRYNPKNFWIDVNPDDFKDTNP